MRRIRGFCGLTNIGTRVPRLLALAVSALCLAPLLLAPDVLLGAWLAVCYGVFAVELRWRQRHPVA